MLSTHPTSRPPGSCTSHCRRPAFRILHIADLYLDKPSLILGLRDSDLAWLIADAVRAARRQFIWRWPVMLIAGELFDGGQNSMKSRWVSALNKHACDPARMAGRGRVIRLAHHACLGQTPRLPVGAAA